MKMLMFARRNAKEILRDPLNLGFGLGFPLVLLLLMSTIQKSVPVRLFEIETLAPGMTVFSLSFMTLFSATLIARDRGNALLQRLYTTPLTAPDFILGYALPMLPISLAQCLVCYLAALLLGLKFSIHVLYAALLILPVSLLFISLGLLCGSVFTDKQVGGVCGALLTNLTAWLSGVWFDAEMVGGAFLKIARALPFLHAVEMVRGALSGNYGAILPNLCWVAGYAALLLALATLCFLQQMKKA